MRGPNPHLDESALLDYGITVSLSNNAAHITKQLVIMGGLQ